MWSSFSDLLEVVYDLLEVANDLLEVVYGLLQVSNELS